MNCEMLIVEKILKFKPNPNSAPFKLTSITEFACKKCSGIFQIKPTVLKHNSIIILKRKSFYVTFFNSVDTFVIKQSALKCGVITNEIYKWLCIQIQLEFTFVF